MNTKIIIGAIAGVVIIGGGVFFMTKEKAVEPKSSACAEACQQASGACPSLISQDYCNDKCPELSEETKKHLQEANTCEQLTAKPELLVDLIIPEVATPEPVGEDASACEAACGNYASKCLSLVPNATQALFEEGLASCMVECGGWEAQKVDCMVNAYDCEAMTDVCGL